MESRNFLQNFICIGIPHIDINELAFFWWTFFSRCRFIEVFTCHLSSRHNRTIRMNRHRYNILLVNIRKLLGSVANVHHYTKTGSGKNNSVILTCVLQITSGIKRPEAMSKFQTEISVWLLAHRGCFFEAWRSTAYDLTLEGVNS